MTDVSEELTAYFSMAMIEAVNFSETSANIYKTARCNIPEVVIFIFVP
jgi:hypothetical protein